MAMLAVPVPKEIGRLFYNIDVPGNKEKPDHITLFYFGDNIKMSQILKIIPAVYEITSNTKPFEAATNQINYFESKDLFPIKLEVESKKLKQLRSNIKNEFEKEGIKFSNDFPKFNPHITLSYSEEKFEKKIPELKWTINEIALYAGDESDSRLYVNFPFSLGLEKNASDNLLEMCNAFYKFSK